MANWRTLKITDAYREIVNMDTGVTRKVFYASEKQIKYLESLRYELAKNKDKYAPLKTKPTTFAAAKAIDKLLAKKQKLEEQRTLL